jgi:hypothetical protein
MSAEPVIDQRLSERFRLHIRGQAAPEFWPVA